MYPYQRATSSSSSSSYPGLQQQQSQQQQQPAPPQQPQPRASSVHNPGSPEQSRALGSGRNYQVSMDEYRHGHHAAHHSHQRGPSDMHELRDAEDRGSRRWMDEQRSYGPPPGHARSSSNAKQQTQAPPPPPSLHSHSNFHSSYSHPASPSHRPRTPPQHHYGSSSRRPSPWDPAQTGPMSAPPSLVPRVNPNGSSSSSAATSSTSALPHPGPLSHHTSPILPGLMRGAKNHSRLPSWGPHSATGTNPSRSEGTANAGAGSGTGSSNSNGPPPPPVTLPFRGQSVGIADGFGRSELGSQDHQERRRRPASDSPPNGGMGEANVLQSSPTQRGDPMSMSSILGPSSRNSELEKRRRLEGATSLPPSSYPPAVKMEGSGLPSVGNTSSGVKITATNVNDSPVSNLARRKWSGPIAEEAAQQAAAWRAQEQRWGSSRSPKVGLTALAGPGPGPTAERTPPMGVIPSLKRGNSPSGGRGEGHKRQRSDGYQAMQDSPLGRTQPLRAPSPPPPSKQAQSQQPQSDHSPAGYNQALPPAGRNSAGPGKQFGNQSHGGSFYRPASPPPVPIPQTANQHQQQQQQQQGSGNAHAPQPKPFVSSSHVYEQPSYHAYDSQGRPVEIDVDEVRGSAFAGHGNPPVTLAQEQHDAYRHGMPYSDPRLRAQASNNQQHVRPTPPPSGPPSKPTATAVSSNLGPAPHHSGGAKNGVQTGGAPRAVAAKEREPKRRSVTPNVPGPAKGLLAPRVERDRAKVEGGAGGSVRPAVAARDFNQGPKVDSEAVWETLMEEQAKRREGESGKSTSLGDIATGESRQASTKARHLGNFQYDPRKSPLLPGELLRANVGVTVEIRVSGRHLGLGPQKGGQKQGEGSVGWGLGWRAKGQERKSDGETRREGGPVDEDEALAFWQQDALVDRKLWGTDVYTDDSDVVAMCLHAGWIQGPALEDVPSWVPPGKAMSAWKEMTRVYADQGLAPTQVGKGEPKWQDEQSRLQRLNSTADLSVIVRIAPKLIAYKGSQRCGVKSRSWGNGHDGVSLVIESVTLQESGYASGERGYRNSKLRIDQLARLKTLATIAMDKRPEEDFSQQVQAGGLIDILIAARHANQPNAKPFWQIDVNNGKVIE